MIALGGRAMRGRGASRVLVVDDDAVVRTGLRLFLHLAQQVELVGEAESGGQAVEMALALRPDVVLLDLVLPDLSGVEVIRRLQAAGLGARIIALVSFSEEDQVPSALAAGAAGYLLKDATPLELAQAIGCAQGPRPEEEGFSPAQVALICRKGHP